VADAKGGFMAAAARACQAAAGQPGLPSMRESFVKRARGRVGLALGLGLGSAAVAGPACVFTPPPALPEELAEADKAQAERRAQVNAGEPATPGASGEGGGAGQGGQPAGGDAAGGAGGAAVFAKGDPPDLGMTPEQMKAYATAQGDPEGGDFTLDEALAGLEGTGELFAELHTTAGVITCVLHEKATPGTVANFVGLARGSRPALDPDTGAWATSRYYDGVEFHRVIPGFMIQGGDPSGTGRGDTGYVIPDEITDDLHHDVAGVLSMANRGPGSGSGQFFITLAPTPHLDGLHTIFGQCDEPGISVAEKIAATRGPNDRPTTPQVIERVEIVRR
jgi:peptidyl-prolyl cis-trans isomerase A (cyclophilin A)